MTNHFQREREKANLDDDVPSARISLMVIYGTTKIPRDPVLGYLYSSSSGAPLAALPVVIINGCREREREERDAEAII